MKKKYFVCSDVHGFFSQLQTALNKKGFDRKNQNHILLICGDILDRGSEAVKMVDFIYDLLLENRAILVRGNHEDLFKQMIARGDFTWADVHNRTLDTLDQLQTDYRDMGFTEFRFGEAIHSYDPRWDFIIQSTVDYYEKGNYIFVHGWIPMVKDWRNASSDDWDRARWTNGMAAAADGAVEPGKTIVCGHWHASYGNVRKKHPGLSDSDYRTLEFKRTDKMSHFKPFKDNGIIAMDGCTAITNFVNVLVLELEDN